MSTGNNIVAQLMDMYIGGLIKNQHELFEGAFSDNESFQKTFGLTLYAMKTFLDLSWEEAADTITDGGGDLGIDAIYYTREESGKLLITICQAKYVSNLSGENSFPESSIILVKNTLSYIFDSTKEFTANDKLKVKIEEIHSLLNEGNIPVIQVLFCNNGKKWNDVAQLQIDELKTKYGEQIKLIYYNHESIFSVLSQPKRVDETLKLSGKMIDEGLGFMRILIGKVPCKEIARIFKTHGDKLLERNVRKYLGQTKSRVNQAIAETLRGEDADNFYFYNNGITLICDKFEYNAYVQENTDVKLFNMQVINGGQTCRTIMESYDTPSLLAAQCHPCVLLRVYQLATDQKDMVDQITYATNNQNPVDLRDLHANDEIQRQLTEGIEKLGFTYKPKRDDIQTKTTETIPSSVLAESVLSVWCRKPFLAKFYQNNLFGRFYNEIFKNLNPAQAVIAVLLFRHAGNERKKKENEDFIKNYPFIPYASHYIAMLMAESLLHSAALDDYSKVDHRNFTTLRETFDREKDVFYKEAIDRIQKAIAKLYGDRQNISLQQLSATFRRSDLMEFLK